jgi:hypothetical protein
MTPSGGVLPTRSPPGPPTCPVSSPLGRCGASASKRCAASNAGCLTSSTTRWSSTPGRRQRAREDTWGRLLAVAFPRVPAFRHGHEQVARLAELLADDAAACTTHRLTLAGALFTVGAGARAVQRRWGRAGLPRRRASGGSSPHPPRLAGLPPPAWSPWWRCLLSRSPCSPGLRPLARATARIRGCPPRRDPRRRGLGGRPITDRC